MKTFLLRWRPASSGKAIRFLRALLTTFGLGLGGLASAQDADTRLETFFKAYLEQSFQQRPLDATRLGDHRFDAVLDDLSADARKQWVKLARTTLEELPKQIDYAQLTRNSQIDFEILRHELTKTLWLAENTKPFEQDPRIYNEYINDSVYLLLTQSTLPKETNVLNAVARMALLPRVITAAKANLHNPPRVVVETAIRQNRGAIGFYEHDLFAFIGDSPQLAAVKAAAQDVVKALREYQEFLEKDLLPSARGEWRIGPEKFARKLELELDSGLTADQVFADAQTEFERVEFAMYVIARQLWSRYHPTQPLPADDTEGRHQTIAQVLEAIARDHGEAQDLVRDVKADVTQIKGFIKERDILRLPEPDRCQVIEMPEFQRGNSTAFMNSAPPLDSRASSFYDVSPPPADWDAARVRSYLEEYNAHMLKILTIHEAYPGHFVQLEYANRFPSLIRRVLQSGVYIEGWAVYTEQMMLDQGFGEGDLALRLTQLKFYLRAVANTILDHNMHAGTFTDAQALDLLCQRSFQSEGEARLKVIRAKQSSCQLSTYFVGRMAHYRLRQQMQRELGDQFNLGRYHEAVLSVASVPVKYLPDLVRERLRQPR